MTKAAAYVPYDGPLVTRAEAREAGLTKYFTGKPCRLGHVTRRWTASGRCCACQTLDVSRRYRENINGRRDKSNASCKAWQQANKEKHYESATRWARASPERAQAYRKAWRDANKEKAAARAKAWRAANRERFDAVANVWRENNRTRVRCIWRSRRARVRGAEGAHTVDEIQALLRKQGNKCAECRKNLKAGYHADHIVPLSRGGSNDIRNIQLLCPSCNLSKHAQHPLDWARKQGRLL